MLGVVASFVASAIEIDRSRGARRARCADRRAGCGRVRRARARSCATSPLTAASSSTATTSSVVSPAASCGRCSSSTSRRGESTSRTRRCASIPRLELPGFRDNLDTRLILFKRRLDERDAPIRLEKTGRGRFRLAVEGAVHLDDATPPPPTTCTVTPAVWRARRRVAARSVRPADLIWRPLFGGRTARALARRNVPPPRTVVSHASRWRRPRCRCARGQAAQCIRQTAGRLNRALT